MVARKKLTHIVSYALISSIQVYFTARIRRTFRAYHNVTKYPTTPQVCRYTTLWNVSVLKATIKNKTTSVTTHFRHKSASSSNKANTLNITVWTVVHTVFGDIAIQWEWSHFDPLQNPNPLTDYDKTLHNRLLPQDKHVTQNLCQSAVRERLAKYVKYKASLFYFYFFPGLAYWSNPCMEFHARWFKTRVVT